MVGVIIFTAFVICVLLWIVGAGAIVFGLIQLAIWALVIAVKVAVALVAALLWCLVLPFAPKRAMAALRGELLVFGDTNTRYKHEPRDLPPITKARARAAAEPQDGRD